MRRENTSWWTMDCGRRAKVRIQFDPSKLGHLVGRAVNSKGLRSTGLRGALVVKIIEIDDMNRVDEQ